ncbi:MAG: conjugal transfer protein TrbB [Nitrospira sp. HN-bin3]|uniref:P-type conjugative transfer ATPase TrbB n=1 Tax=Nitrospira cf. moscoviensis SBR1015 TaxID=96242 RepID=UPI000A0E627A|nr:P-type conjugative transfer ATPase TrbB [Nitrospira cf. moscoviensis SBR1015]OQW33701.1 MAG: conjugal transfer protein TrbB [Nitrospira sp. HN-bin3]
MDDGPSTRERARRMIERDMGALLLDTLNDACTVEVMLNADGRLWCERLGQGMECIGRFPAARAEAIIKTVAGFHRKEITRQSPYLDGEFPLDGSRFAAQIPPIVPAPAFAIRKRALAVFRLDQYVEQGIMTERQRDVLLNAIKTRRNILVVGGTGSGKTTLVNALIDSMMDAFPHLRVFIFEDTAEIQCRADNCVQYHTTVDVTMAKLLKISMRMRPDTILVGEVRGPEALDLLMAWNSGHEGGIATLHANNARAGLSKLALYISMNQDYPKPIEPLIAEAVQVLVHITRCAEGRRVEDILEVQGYEDGQYITRSLIN